MSRTKTFLSSLAFLALLCLQAQAFPHSLRNTVMNAYASTSGIVELKKDANYIDSFYVEADLSYYPEGPVSGPDSTETANTAGTVKMYVSIVNSESMVAANCLYYNSYDCSQYSNCTQSDIESTIEFPGLIVDTKAAKADLILDYKYWSLSSSASLYIAQSCKSTNGKSSGGYGRSGIIGLGTEGAARDDLTSSKMFSIYIKPDLKEGKLLFKNDASTYAQSSKPTHTFTANSTWQIALKSSGSIKVGGGATVNLNVGNVMFDINSDAIGLPFDIYKSFISSFNEHSGAKCSDSVEYRPTCYYTENIQNLPDITLAFNDYNLVIPSKIYASTVSEGVSFALNFRATSPTHYVEYNVPPSFQNSVILDARFMSYYYTVFDASSNANVISLYKIKADGPSSSNNTWIYIAVGVVLIIVILGGCYVKKKGNNVNNSNIAALVDHDVDAYNPPLVSNRQAVNN